VYGTGYSELKHIICAHQAEECNHVLKTSFYPLTNILKVLDSNKSKAIPIQDWTGHEFSRRLRLSDFMTVDTRRW